MLKLNKLIIFLGFSVVFSSLNAADKLTGDLPVDYWQEFKNFTCDHATVLGTVAAVAGLAYCFWPENDSPKGINDIKLAPSALPIPLYKKVLGKEVQLFETIEEERELKLN